VKEPDVTPKPTFFGHPMTWVGSKKPTFFGSFWRYRSPSGKIVVRAWPSQLDDDFRNHQLSPEVNLSMDVAGDFESWFEGKYHTHKALLRALRRAESEARRAFKEFSRYYNILKEVVDD
jgi:hypothetical protein